MLVLVVATVFLLEPISAQKPSTCPTNLIYEQREAKQDSYYAWIFVPKSPPISGLSLHITLDQPTHVIWSEVGEIEKKDDRSFLIQNPKYRFDPSSGPMSIRFLVKYNPKNIPNVVGIRLNGKVLCPLEKAEATTTQDPQIFISNNGSGSPPLPLQSGSQPFLSRQPDDGKPGTPPPVAAAQPEVTTPKLFLSRKPDKPIVAVKPQAQAPPQIAGNADLPISAVLPSIAVNDESCGVVKVSARPLIIKGQATLPGQWPWHAALYRYSESNLKYICGGSLITRSHVLTAAHCVVKLPSETLHNADLFEVYLGRYSNESSPIIQVRTVSKITVHPEFNAGYLRNDIAVMRLKDPVEYTDFVQPVCIWQGDDNLDNIVDELGTVVGWGLNESGEQSETLMQAHMPVVSTLDCIFSNRQFFSQFASYNTFCAGFRNGSSPCTGDSGGGMVLPRSGSSGQNVVWYVRGVVSLSVSVENNRRVPCDTKNYVLFTDVAKYLSWLEYVIKR